MTDDEPVEWVSRPAEKPSALTDCVDITARLLDAVRFGEDVEHVGDGRSNPSYLEKELHLHHRDGRNAKRTAREPSSYRPQTAGVSRS